MSAEQQARRRAATGGPMPGGSLPGGSIEQLRQRIAVMSGRPDMAGLEVSDPGAGVLPIPEAFAELLPQNGITRGTVTVYEGARSLLSALIATVTEDGGQVGVIGMPRLGLLSAVQMGARLSRIALVPEPGPDAVEVASVLLDGMDLVVLDLRGAHVAPSRARVVMGRLRTRSSTLLVTGGRWPGAHSRLDARVMTYRHLPIAPQDSPGRGLSGGDLSDGGLSDAALSGRPSGYGRIAGMRLQVTSTIRGREHATVEADLTTSGHGDAQRVRLEAVRRPVRPEFVYPESVYPESVLAVAN